MGAGRGAQGRERGGGVRRPRAPLPPGQRRRDQRSAGPPRPRRAACSAPASASVSLAPSSGVGPCGARRRVVPATRATGKKEETAHLADGPIFHRAAPGVGPRLETPRRARDSGGVEAWTRVAPARRPPAPGARPLPQLQEQALCPPVPRGGEHPTVAVL